MRALENPVRAQGPRELESHLPAFFMSLLLRTQSLQKSFGIRQLFRGISISFDEGERTGLIGPNGAGKSTLLKILAGIEQPDAGTITARRQLRLGYVPQDDVF